ncbi:MAG TPA: hemerythrin domain-containing protein [Patescibacteria group bacterium]|nr:hemerythrin domain-containing protein [Patescibacteria group bacterium]
MSESAGSAEGRRQQVLEKLRLFEEAADRIRPGASGAETSENVARFRESAEQLRLHLSQHLASKETIDWPELPDSDAEISAFAHELKTEHRDLLNELAQLIRAAGEMEKTFDRADAATRLRSQSRAVALRVARHAGEEEASLGNYS